jgi:hypothetical protein
MSSCAGDVRRPASRVAVFEAKGFGGSAGERNSAQLEKWVAEYFDAHDVHPKPILVVNAHRTERDLGKRREPFPNQMLGYATRRGHCLLTAMQLLGAVLDVEGNPSHAEEVIGSLFSAEGVWTRYQDPYAFLSQLQEGVVSADG